MLETYAAGESQDDGFVSIDPPPGFCSGKINVKLQWSHEQSKNHYQEIVDTEASTRPVTEWSHIS
jgi:hypothetical protein